MKKKKKEERDEFGAIIRDTSQSYIINQIIISGERDYVRIAELLISKGLESKSKSRGLWIAKPETDFDKTMNRVLSHIQFLREEKPKSKETVRARMKSAEYNHSYIEEKIAWLKSELPEPKSWAKDHRLTHKYST